METDAVSGVGLGSASENANAGILATMELKRQSATRRLLPTLGPIAVIASLLLLLESGSTPRGAVGEPHGSKSASTPSAMTALSPAIRSEEHRLRLHSLRTGEYVDVIYRVGGRYSTSGIAQLDHLLRDNRTGQDAHYPVSEFDLLDAIMRRLHRPGGMIDIICGYRSPETNTGLRNRGPDTGVAENSQHILSRAIDIRVPGVSTVQLRNAALALRMGGVGYYPISRFVHVDVGPVRQWAFAPRTNRRHEASFATNVARPTSVSAGE